VPRRRRPENKGLPARWRFYHGACYYHVPPGLEHRWDGKKQFRLGNSLPEAYRTWASRLEYADSELTTIGQLLDRYALEVVPTKAPQTQKGNAEAIRRLKAVFGDMSVVEFRPQHAYQYRDRRGRQSPTQANRELEVLSHSFTKAIEWGVRDTHPMIEGKFRKIPTTPRSRYVEDWEIIEALSLESRRKSGSVLAVRAYIRLKLLTGLRRGDLLRLHVADMKDDGIHVTPQKTAQTTGKRLILEWTDTLRTAVEDAIAARPVHIAPWLFCNRRGECYVKTDGSANGWESMWQRFMDRVLKEKSVSERFTGHDLRAKCASDAESLEHAQRLLAHADSALTRRIYRRKPERVKPLA
jgi:integrase